MTWTHRYVIGLNGGPAPGPPRSRVIFEDKRPSGTPDGRGTMLLLGVGEKRRRYVIGAAVKDVAQHVVRYRCYEVLREENVDLSHADIVRAVRQAPHQVAMLLRELLGSTLAVAACIGSIAPESTDA